MEPQHVRTVTARIVAAYAGNHSMTSTELTGMIGTVAQTISGLGTSSEPVVEARQKPAVSVRRAIQPDHITCLDCGKEFKMLKRHLGTDHDLTPEKYRLKWDLPSNYPMTAPNYAEVRSTLAKQSGLGTHKNAPKSRRRAAK